MSKATKEYNFKKTNPHLLKEWHPVKNGKLKPDQITPFSNTPIWWICKEGHEWQSKAYNRSRGTGCPICSKKNGRPFQKKWISSNRKIAYGKTFRKVENKSSDTVLVEIPIEALPSLVILTSTPKGIGKLIREYRESRGLSQEEFAGMVGHCRNYIGLLEQGKSDRVAFNVFQRIISFILE